LVKDKSQDGPGGESTGREEQDMKVAIIGAGNVGGALGGSLVRAGHQVTFAARDAAKAREVAGKVGAQAAATVEEAADSAEVVVLAVPFGSVEDVAGRIAGSVGGKVVVDATNPLKADYSGLAIEGTSAAELLAARLGDAKVVKAFNTTFAGVDANPAALGTTLDALFATDDADARAVLVELAGSIGFRPVYVGPLAAARELEAMAWLNIRLQMLTNGSWTSSYVLVGAPEAAVAA
jgi:predicted dinucleotide-binding enzyme